MYVGIRTACFLDPCVPFADARALVRLQADHVNRSLVPAFYRYIQAQDEGTLSTIGVQISEPNLHLPYVRHMKDTQILTGKEYVQAIEGLVKLFQRAEKEAPTLAGLWQEGGKLSLADVMAAPCESSVFLSELLSAYTGCATFMRHD